VRSLDYQVCSLSHHKMSIHWATTKCLLCSLSHHNMSAHWAITKFQFIEPSQYICSLSHPKMSAHWAATSPHCDHIGARNWANISYHWATMYVYSPYWAGSPVDPLFWSSQRVQLLNIEFLLFTLILYTLSWSLPSFCSISHHVKPPSLLIEPPLLLLCTL
jgi:hypothetical protein